MRWSLQLREDIGTISWPLQLLHASFAVVLTMDHNAFLWAKGLWALHTSSANIFSFAAALLRCSVTLMLDSIMSDPFGRKLPWWKPVRSMFASMLTVPDAKSLSFFSVMSCCGLWQANDKWLRGGVILISVAVSHSKQTCICECVCVCVCVHCMAARYHQCRIAVQVPVVTEGELLLNSAVYSHRPAQVGLQRVHDLSVRVFEGGRQFSSCEDKDNVQKRLDEWQ